MAKEKADPDDTILVYNFTWFLKQENAFQFVDSKNIERTRQNLPLLYVFAREYASDGTRYFVTEDLPTFYIKYMNMRDSDRSFYEIIRKSQPSRLYFDLEFDKRINPTADSKIMMKLFRKRLVAEVQVILGIDLKKASLKDDAHEYFVQLDSSTEIKFSVHLILILPGETFFANNQQVGDFVQLIWNKIYQDNGDRTFIIKKRDKFNQMIDAFFADMSVYSNNRHFRLVLSAKFNEIGRRHFKYMQYPNAILQEQNITSDLFFRTLASYFGNCSKDSVMILRWNTSIKLKSLPNTDFKVQSCFKNAPCHSGTMERFSSVISYFSETVLKRWGSLYNEREDPNLLKISKVIYYENSERLIIKPKTNRYCTNVQREHTHNGIYFQIDIANFNYTQRCFSHSCNGYSSDIFGVPPELFFKRMKLSPELFH